MIYIATYIRKLKDRSGNYILPAVRSQCVYMYTSGSNTLDKEFSSLQTKVNQKTTLTEVINKIYPVGAIWFTTSYDSPASLFGGSWERITDRFLVGAGNRYGRGATGGADSVKLTASQIPTLSMQILLSKGGYCAGGAIPQSFVKSSKDPSVVNNDLFADLNGQTCDRIVESSYSNSSLVRYYNSNQASVPTNPPFYACYIWRRTA